MQVDVAIGLAQVEIESLAPERNLIRCLDAVGRAADAGADLVVLPELSDLGQVREFDLDFATRFVGAARPLATNSFLADLRSLARERNIHLVVGVAEAHAIIPDTVANTVVLITTDGAVAGVQRKLHLPGEERHYFATGDDIVVVSTELGVISMQICYDLHFPEVARVAALRGAEILIGVANIPHRQDWADRLSHLAAVRAYENMQPVAIVNRVGTDHGIHYGGGSVMMRPPGVLVAACEFGVADVRVASVNAKSLAEERIRRPVFADRRPTLYTQIADPAIGEALL